jgi:O-antigen/teichoic acid export membrane protein
MAESRLGHKATALMSFAMSMAAGGAQFLALIFLNHILDKESFSRVSTVLGTFSVFFIIVELGIQGENIRRMSKDGPRSVLSSAMALRLGLSVVAILSGLLFAWKSQLSGPMMWGMFLFSLSYVPTSVLYTFEELGYATRDSFFVILYRLSRLTGAGFFVAAILALAYGSGELPLNFESFGRFSLFALYPLAISLLLVLALVRLRKLGYLRKIASRDVVDLAMSSRFLALSTLFRWVAGYVFSLMVIAAIGEQNLSAYNLSNIALTPLSIFTQVFINASLAKMYKQTTYEVKPFLLKASLLITSVIAVYTLICSQPLFVGLVFKRIEMDSYLRMFVPLSLAQIFIAISSFISIIFMDKQKPQLVAASTAIYCVIVLCLAPVVSALGLMDYATIVPLIGAMVSFGYYIWELSRLATQGDLLGNR